MGLILNLHNMVSRWSSTPLSLPPLDMVSENFHNISPITNLVIQFGNLEALTSTFRELNQINFVLAIECNTLLLFGVNTKILCSLKS